MPRARQIKITKDGEEAFVLEESVKAWERHGWTVADDGSSEEAEKVADKPIETQVETTVESTEGEPPAKKTTTRKAP